MNGHVFQTHTKARKLGQFNKSLEALKILAAMEYKNDIKYLDTLFRNLEKPSIPIPVLPVAEVVKNQDGEVMFDKDEKVKMEINQVKAAIYNESVKSYVVKVERLGSTLDNLYHVMLQTIKRQIKSPRGI